MNAQTFFTCSGQRRGRPCAGGVPPGGNKGGTRRPEAGYTLVGMIGVLTVLAIGWAALAPNTIGFLDRETADREAQHLRAIVKGTERYLRNNRGWPLQISDLSPDYVPFSKDGVTKNDRQYPRYLAVHPNVLLFTNALGLDESALPDARFLIISNVELDALPTITTVTHFENWWETDEAAIPGLYIGRGRAGNALRNVTLTWPCAGGSYQIHGAPVNSLGVALPTYDKYHLKGTTIGLDGADIYPLGSPDVEFTLNADAEYRHCGNGWKMGQNGACGGGEAVITVRDEFESGTYAGNDGTTNWTTAWQETGEADGPDGGFIELKEKPGRCAAGNCLWLTKGALVPIRISRAVDLSSFSCGDPVTLTYTANRAVDAVTLAVATLEVSANGGGLWTVLRTWLLVASDGVPVPESHDLTPFISSDTQVRFSMNVSAGSDSAAMRFDNVQIGPTP